MKNVLLTIEYDGSGFHGWQEQPGQRTVQGELQNALSEVTGQDIKVNGTSRTDAGVHALGQCCTFSGDFGIPIEKLKLATNNLLSEGRTGGGTKPGDIRIVDVKEVPEGFHARFNCIKKTYRYLINTGEPHPFNRDYCYYVDPKSGDAEAEDSKLSTATIDKSIPSVAEAEDCRLIAATFNNANAALDFSAMEKAAEYIVGTHDFACFQAAGGTPRESTVRTIYELRINPQIHWRAKEVEIDITGDGFLYNMVRIIVGTLVEVGQGRRSPESVKKAIEARDRTLAGHTAPPEGLYLAKIYFDDIINKL